MLPTLFVWCILSFGNVPQEFVPQPEPRYIVIYDIHDLQLSIPDYIDIPTIDLSQALAKERSPFRERNTPLSVGPSKIASGQEVINLITAYIEPEVWGEEASIRYFRGTLIVDAPKRIHDQIR